MTYKYVVVFDIDGTICCREYEDNLELTKQLYPEVVRGNWTKVSKWGYESHYYFLCLPQLDALFNYLMKFNVRIAFFSAAYEERNVHLLGQILPQYFGNERYQDLKEAGQFEIFSDQHLVPGDRDLPKGKYNEGNSVKDLRRVVKPYEDIENAILIEDDSSFPKFGQNYILTIDVSNWWHTEIGTSHDFYLNGVYYLTGIFKEYFEKEQYSNLWLGNGIDKIFHDHGIRNEKYFAMPEKPFVRKMVYNGFNEVVKTHEEAILYGVKSPVELIGELERTEDFDL